VISEAESAVGTIRQVVRGERPWTDLLPLGMEGGPQEKQCRFRPSFPGHTQVSIYDIARGFLTCLGDVSKLREWAFVVEAVPAEFDVENHPAGEAVLDALWSASFGEPLGEDQLAVLKELGEEQSGQP